MCSVHKIIKQKSASERGFVLVVAIMAIVVMIAVGFFALTMISGDLMITSRWASERQAFSAAESGVHSIFASIDLENPGAANVTNMIFDPADPNVTYSASTQPANRQVIVPGFKLSSLAPVFETVVTGRNARDASTVSISIGVTPPPQDATTDQGEL